VPLDAAAEAWVASWRLPAEAEGLPCVASPLARARRTAEILTGAQPSIEPRLAEMGYGAWEGERLPDLRRRLGVEMAAMESHGWHFTPPGGESPAMVLARIKPWLADIAAAGSDRLAVCHNGVIRAIVADAIGWDLTGKPPVKLLDGMAHLLSLTPGGDVRIDRLNHPLTDRPAPVEEEGFDG
jgi:probable phosphoglycerate mutase